METLIVNKATKKDLELLISIAQKLGIDVEIASKKPVFKSKKKPTLTKKEREKAIMELSKKVNRAVHEKYVKPVLDDCYNRQ
jgi:hypothetical protein